MDRKDDLVLEAITSLIKQGRNYLPSRLIAEEAGTDKNTVIGATHRLEAQGRLLVTRPTAKGEKGKCNKYRLPPHTDPIQPPHTAVANLSQTPHTDLIPGKNHEGIKNPEVIQEPGMKYLIQPKDLIQPPEGQSSRSAPQATRSDSNNTRELLRLRKLRLIGLLFRDRDMQTNWIALRPEQQVAEVFSLAAHLGPEFDEAAMAVVANIEA